MKNIFLLALIATLLLSCTAGAQNPAPPSVTAAPFCDTDTSRLPPLYQCMARPSNLGNAKTASNIKLGDTTIMACFDKYTVIMGVLWNCVCVYSSETGEIVFMGDGIYSPVDTRTISCSGDNFYVRADIYTGTGEIYLPESGKRALSRPTFDGAVSSK